MIITGAIIGAYAAGSAVNHSSNPASWDWSSGKTWGAIFGGAILGGLAAGGGLGAAAGVEAGVAAAGLTGGAAAAATIGGTALAIGAISGTASVAFAAMGGETGSDLGKAFGVGFAMGFVMSIPVVGEVALTGMAGYDTYQTIKDPSVGNGIALGMDLLFLGMAAAGGFGESGEAGAAESSEAGAESGSRAGVESARSSMESGEAGAGSTDLGCSSFTGDTEVITQDGKKDIEDIVVGDQVWGYDERLKTEGLYPVTQLFGRTAEGSVLITAGEEVIETTPEHPFYVQDQGWINAGDLVPGYALKQRDGNSVSITAIEMQDKPVQVYNFEVANVHNYYVSDEEVLAHNPRRCSNRFKKAHGSSNKKDAKKQAQKRVDQGNKIGTDKHGKAFNTSVDTKNLSHGARDAVNPANGNTQYRTKNKVKGYNTKFDKRGRAKKPRKFNNRVYMDKKNGEIYHFDGVAGMR